MVLGAFDDVPYEESTVTLAPGDTILFVTDGITEATAADGTQFGDDRLEPLASDLRGLDASALVGTIGARLRAARLPTMRRQSSWACAERRPVFCALSNETVPRSDTDLDHAGVESQ
jgi:hypothetical protein